MQRITIKDLGNTDAWGNELTDAQKKDFMFLLENVQAGSGAAGFLGFCPRRGSGLLSAFLDLRTGLLACIWHYEVPADRT